MFRQFGNKGYSLFGCLGREVVCSVLSVATLTYASAESVSTHPVVTDYNWLQGAPDEESGCENGHCTGPHRYCAGSRTKY